jgi:hypothetical protein
LFSTTAIIIIILTRAVAMISFLQYQNKMADVECLQILLDEGREQFRACSATFN